MEIAGTIAEARRAIGQAKKAGKRVGLVPTMGALHAGHVCLIRAAKGQCDCVVVSIFVNPTQFGPTEDFDRYPRPVDQDLKTCQDEGVDLVFMPSASQMYRGGTLTWVDVERLTEPLCGRYRPGHFRGVTTVCAKLFNIIQPDKAYFGQKDAQQAVVIQRMVEDLDFPLQIVVCPTVRADDGLAISSRNQYLTAAQRADAPVLYQALCRAADLIRQGQRDPAKVVGAAQAVIARVPDMHVQYVSIVDARTLEPVDPICGRVLIAAAVYLGQTRLIDNLVVDVP